MSLARELIIPLLESRIPKRAAIYVRPAFEGDATAASRLFWAAPNEDRGDIAVAAHYAEVPLPARREILANVWDHDHREFIRAAGGEGPVRRMMRSARFPVSLSDRVALYRGGPGSVASLRSGLSWSLSPKVAAWFATRFYSSRLRSADCIVITTEVDASEIIFAHDERGEDEVITRRAIKSASLYGTPEDWRVWSDEQEARNRAEQAAMLNEARTRAPTDGASA